MKKLIFMGSYFYGYEQEIINELKKDHEVLYINMIPSTLKLICFNILKQIFGKNIYEFFLIKEVNKRIIKKLKSSSETDFDTLLVIGWGLLSKVNLKTIEEKVNIQKKILYLWDNKKKLKNLESYQDYFDKICSFDKKDCEQFGYEYVSTFYSKGLEEVKRKNYEDEYIFSFIGHYDDKRVEVLTKLKRINLGEIYIYQYINKWIFILKIWKLYKKRRELNFKKISRENYNIILKKSKIILDLISGDQVGVTQRALDALYLEKKVISNNHYIKNYSFYNPNNIYVVDDKLTKEKLKNEIENFLKKPYIKIEDKIVAEYNIETWKKKVLN